VNAATFLLVVIFEYLFLRSFIGWVISFFPPAGVVFYIGLPYLCVLALAKLKPDGKKVHFYLWDWFCYMIRMMNGDCVYYNWDKVSNNALEELLFVNKYVYLED
ncbi:TPA: TcpE family conjugal transfer membrane protein, partial [Enterococcus faecium]|nr:hypothetical protein [Enterococcus faecium]HAQ5135286.1 hypothetical protein [Enterococcus faecium]HAQ5160921.1 hypothetical protein [Enterococcus faecium]HAQ5169604.1 hypothetical protein [Enterococcus faecium]HAQ5175435.1 hypothetical protein [Enterococcus faecium]